MTHNARNVEPNEFSILRLPDVKRRTGLGRSTIYAAMREGKFPRSIRLTARCVGWSTSSIEAWVRDRIEAR
ncbi:helix-turn-helix transcriptional regulator [Paraburkholderia sp. DGU8]|uniref:helix-turn-helix transcriptional regulator n=1 Tax=Paraburkholderia sp. DGU8 TaxID=3161997 RepID=UPI003464F163